MQERLLTVARFCVRVVFYPVAFCLIPITKLDNILTDRISDLQNGYNIVKELQRPKE